MSGITHAAAGGEVFSSSTHTRGSGRLRAILEADHRGIQRLLDAAEGDRRGVDVEAWDAFRARFLRHMAIEDELLFRAASVACGAPFDPRLALEHRAMATLLVAPPDRALIRELRALMLDHDAREDHEGGAYDRCESLLGERIDGLVDAARTYPFPPLPPAREDATARTASDALRLAAGLAE